VDGAFKFLLGTSLVSIFAAIRVSSAVWVRDWKLASALEAFAGPALLLDLLVLSVFVAGNGGGDARVGHILVSLVTFQMCGHCVSLDESGFGYGIALALSVSLYAPAHLEVGPMKLLVHKIFRGLIDDTRGTEIAEAAAVLPLMFMILLGIFWFGQAFSIYGAITRAAHDGARAGSIPYCATCSGASTLAQGELNAANAIQADLLASRLDPNKARYPVPPPFLPSCGGGPAPQCSSGGNANYCIQAPVQLTDPATGATGLCGISVSFQYPFQFWLPFTSLNKQKIWILASSRMRVEN
jgi:hypothetical protein